jgi:hypothetical protein
MPIITRFLEFCFIEAEMTRRHEKHEDSYFKQLAIGWIEIPSATMVPSKVRKYFH